jgi:hypothetical protein
MDPAPALPSMVAKMMVLMDRMLDVFATSAVAHGEGPCEIPVYHVCVTDCGQALIDAMAEAIYHMTVMASQMLGAMSTI